MRMQNIALSGLTASLLLTGLAFTGTGCAGDRYQRSTGAYLDDKGITTRVKTALFRDPAVSGFDVHVNTFRGDVQLSGFVDTQEQKDRAAEIARRVEGVASVANNVEVKPAPALGTPGAVVEKGTESSIQPIPDRPVTDRTTTIPDHTTTHVAPVQPSTDTTVNRLDEHIPPAGTVVEPVKPAGRVAPLRSPTDNDTSRNVTTSATDATRTQLDTAPRSTMADNLQISVSNGQATIRGTAANDDQKREIERQVRSIPGVREINNQLQVGGSSLTR